MPPSVERRTVFSRNKIRLQEAGIRGKEEVKWSRVIGWKILGVGQQRAAIRKDDTDEIFSPVPAR